jgi:glutaredoxin
MAKDFFREKNLEFVEVNVAEDEAALKEMFAKSGQTGVPVIEIDGKIVKGFNRPELERMLGK